MEHRHVTTRVALEDRSLSFRAAVLGRAACETMEHRLRYPTEGGGDPEDRSLSLGAAVLGCSVEATGRVHDDAPKAESGHLDLT